MDFFTIAILLAFGLVFLSIKIFKAKKNYIVSGLSVVSGALISFIVSLPSSCDEGPQSEACVWGKSFFPLTVGLSVLLIVPLTYLIFTGVNELLKKQSSRS